MHVPRRDRALVFREFVLQTFAGDLRAGTVLDVAGGRGDLSWLLANVDGADAVVVDPRAADHHKIERTALWHWEHRDEDPSALATARGPQGVLGALRPVPPFRAPRQLQVPLDEAFLAALVAEEEDAGVWDDFWRKSAGNPEAAPAPAGVRDSGEVLQLLRGTRLLLGFHPDQATEPCVDLALRLRVPFAVCPCCVFPALFPRRRLAGRPVKSYGDFVEYLRRKHPRVQVSKLPFDDDSGAARNVVLLMRAQDFEEGVEEPPPPLPPVAATGRPVRPRPAAATVLQGDLAMWAELGPGAGGAGASRTIAAAADAAGARGAGASAAADDDAAVGPGLPAAWERCFWRAAACDLEPAEVLGLGRVGRRWHSACLLLCLHEQPLPARRRLLRAQRAELLEALAVFRTMLERSEVTDAFHPARQATEDASAWKQLNTDLSAGVARGEPAAFDRPGARAEYFLRHLPTRCWHLPHLLLAEEPLLRHALADLLFPLGGGSPGETSSGRPCVRVASLGGGPGYDAVGLALLAAQQRLRVRFEVANLDHEPAWEDVVRATDAHLCAPLGHHARFGRCDITEGLEAGPNALLAAELGPSGPGFHAFVAAFVVATNAQRLEATDFRFFRQLFAAAAPKALFFFADATHRSWPHLVAAAAEAGAFEVALPQFERGRGLHGFPKHALVLRKRSSRELGAEAASPSARALLARCEEHRRAHGREQSSGGGGRGATEGAGVADAA